MLAPAILYIVLLVGFPFLLSLYYSVSSVTVASQDMHFVGLENFRRVVESSTFWLSLQNTIVITVVSQFFVLVFANILATALVVDFRGRWLVRLLILLPWVAPISLGSIGWLWIFDSIYSVINWTARAVGLLGPNEWPIWLGQPTLARASIIIVNVWRILPLATIIILAGLSSIPRDIHDAAEVRPASRRSGWACKRGNGLSGSRSHVDASALARSSSSASRSTARSRMPPRLDEHDLGRLGQHVGQQLLGVGEPRQPALHAVEQGALAEALPLLAAPRLGRRRASTPGPAPRRTGSARAPGRPAPR